MTNVSRYVGCFVILGIVRGMALGGFFGAAAASAFNLPEKKATLAGVLGMAAGIDAAFIATLAYLNHAGVGRQVSWAAVGAAFAFVGIKAGGAFGVRWIIPGSLLNAAFGLLAWWLIIRLSRRSRDQLSPSK